MLTKGGAKLEPMPRPATDEPHVRRLRVAVDNQVLVGRVFLLADTRFKERCVG